MDKKEYSLSDTGNIGGRKFGGRKFGILIVIHQNKINYMHDQWNMTTNLPNKTCQPITGNLPKLPSPKLPVMLYYII